MCSVVVDWLVEEIIDRVDDFFVGKRSGQVRRFQGRSGLITVPMTDKVDDEDAIE